MKSKSAKAVLISIIISLVIVIAVSLVLLFWALPSGVIQSMALSHFLTALVPILGVSLVMAISSLWIKSGKQRKQPPFDEDVIKEPSSYDSPLYGDLDADDYVSPFKVKSMTPEDWDYIEEFEGLPEKQKKRILASMKRPIERPNINFDDLSENYPFTESFDFHNVPFDTYAFDKPENPRITPFLEKVPETLPELEEFPEVDFGEDRFFESPLAPKLRDILFNPEYTTYKLDGDKVLIAKNDDFNLKRPIYHLTASEGCINFVWHKDEKEREPQEKYVAPSILWKMIGEFLIKLKPVNVKRSTKTITPSVENIETEEVIEKRKALATVQESIDAYALLSLPEDVKENPETLEEKQETTNAISTVKYRSDSVIADDATTEEAFSSLMSSTSEVYTANDNRSYANEDQDNESDYDDETTPLEAIPSIKLDVTGGVYDISYHEEFEDESDAFVIKYDHSKKDEALIQTPTPDKTTTSQSNGKQDDEAQPIYTEPLPESPLFSLNEKEVGTSSDPYTIKYTHDTLPSMSSFEFDVQKPKTSDGENNVEVVTSEDQLEFPELEEDKKLPPFTIFEFDVEKPAIKALQAEDSTTEQAIIPSPKNEVALKEFDKIIPFDDNREVQVKEKSEIVSKEETPLVPYEKGEISNIQSSEVSPTLPPFSSYEFEVSSATTPSHNSSSDKDDNSKTVAILSNFDDFNTGNSDYRNDLAASFNALKTDEDVPSYECTESDNTETESSEETEEKYTPNKIIGENPTLLEAYDALMKCGVFTSFEFDVDKAIKTPENAIIASSEKKVYDIPEGREEVLNSFDSLPLPEEMYDREPLTEAEGAVEFKWNADTAERPEPEEYIAPTDEQIAKGEFAAKLAPSKAASEPITEVFNNDQQISETIDSPIETTTEIENKENSLVPEFDKLYTPSDMYDKVLSLKHRESYDALSLPEKMPLTRARSVVPFSWLEDKGEPIPEEEYIAPTDEQIAKGEFVAKLSPVDIIKHPITAAENAIDFTWNADTAERPEAEAYIEPTDEQIAKGEFAAKLAPSKASSEPITEAFNNDQQLSETIASPIETTAEIEDRENSLVPEFDELYIPSDMYDKVLSLKHRESFDALSLPEKMPLTRARSVVPFSWLEDKGEPIPEEEYIAPTDEQIAKGEFVAKLSPVDIIKHPITAAENAIDFTWNADTAERPEAEKYIAPTDEQIAKGEFVAKLSPVDISKLPSTEDEENEEVSEDNETTEEIVIDNEEEAEEVAPIQEEETTPTVEEEQTPETFIEAFNDILEIEMSEARKFDYELTIARIISEKADDIARLDIEAMAFMEDEDKLCIIFPCQTKQEATELIHLIKDAVGDKNMKVRIAELRGRGITAAVFSLEIFR